MPTEYRWKLIQRYISHRCSEEERAEVERWMDQHPDNRRMVEELQEIWDLSPEEDFSINVQEAWNTFRARKIKKETPGNVSYIPSGHSKGWVLTVFRVAAALLLVAFAGFFSWQYLSKQDDSITQRSQFNTMKNIVTQKGEKAQITFSDGTVVTVNAASTLRFPKVFRGSERVVHLDGEAYFEVAPNKEKPFIVYTGKAKIKVLGTKFNVHAWNEDKVAEVGVREGKVAVNSLNEKHKGDGILLRRGEYTTVSDDRGVAAAQKVDVNKYMLWLNGGMYFDNEPFADVVRKLERRFDIRITVADKQLLEVPFTGTFRQARLKEVLNVVSASMGIEYSRQDSLIQFTY